MIISVKVTSGSREEKINCIVAPHYIVYVKERAHDGKANLALLKVLKKHFKADHIKIIKGYRSRNKIVEVT